MRAAIYNPYLDTLGGGERYTMAVARALLKKEYKVDVQWKTSSIKGKLEERFGIKLDGINFVKDIKRGDGYDACFWVSDGSIPLLRARKNYLHFQIPFCDVNGKTLLNRMKLYRVNMIICNSYFTKEFIDKEYGVESKVIYPPVAVDKFRPKRKENSIISIGRFSQLTQAKRQGVLVGVFRRLYDLGYEDWKMILAGGVEVGVGDYVEKLKDKSRGYPIEIIESPSFGQIKALCGKAKIFWSASGFGVDEEKEPKRVEHFGIAAVEAMAAGAVPIVFNAGGHKEIVTDGENGFLFKTTRELLGKTRKLIEEKRLMTKLSTKSRENSKVYEYERFEKEIWDIL